MKSCNIVKSSACGKEFYYCREHDEEADAPVNGPHTTPNRCRKIKPITAVLQDINKLDVNQGIVLKDPYAVPRRGYSPPILNNLPPLSPPPGWLPLVNRNGFYKIDRININYSIIFHLAQLKNSDIYDCIITFEYIFGRPPRFMLMNSATNNAIINGCTIFNNTHVVLSFTLRDGEIRAE